MKPRPGGMPYKNKITITLTDIDLEKGTINLESSFEQTPDIDYGPQTPAEEVAALMMTFAHRHVLNDNHDTGAILLADEWQTEAFGGGSAN